MGTTASRRAGFCRECGVAMQLRRFYCSDACLRSARERNNRHLQLRVRECPHCHANYKPSRREQTCCSVACASAYGEKRNQYYNRYDDALIAQLKALCDAGLLTRAEISRQLAIPPRSLIRLVQRHQLRSPPTKPPGQRAAARPAQRAKRQKAAPAQPQAPRKPIAIPLRDVYRYAAELGLPRSRAGDIAAVSAAKRRKEPGHPGFVLENLRRTFSIISKPPP